MKNRSKMILGLASMLGISAGAAAVSGFAWFTTQRTASINEASYKVGASEGSLKIEAVASTAINCTASVNANVCTVNPADKSLADVSSADGKNFYKAVLNTTGSAIDTIKTETAPSPYTGSWMSSANATQMVCVSWTLKVSNEGSKSVDVYLSKSGALFDVDTTVNAETESVKATSGQQAAFNVSYKIHSITSVTLDSTPVDSSKYTFSGKTLTITDTDTQNAVTQNSTLSVTYKADFTEFYRMAIYNTADESAPVFLYSHADHLRAMTDADKANDTGLTGDTDITANAKTGNLVTITNSTEASDAGTTVASNNQLLLKGLTNGADKNLKFVIWCEGTATPEKAVMANLVKTSMGLVAINN